MTLRVLIADDSILFRRVIAEALGSLPDVEVVGAVPNGKLAVQRVRELRPDLLTLDMEMPELDGMGVLEALKESREAVAVIVVSALTRQGGRLTLRALEKGAFDFITKPDTVGSEESKEAIRKELAPRIRALTHRLEIRKILQSKAGGPASAAPAERAPTVRESPNANLAEISGRMSRLAAVAKPEMVLIGVSTGGPNALAKMMPEIPGNIGVPLLIVQHMPPVFTQSLAESLAPRCAVRVREASHGELIEPNMAYIAPGGRHMRLVPGPEGRKMVQVTDDPPENNCRPAVDYLFRSVANSFPGRAMAVILTGMGSDGVLGLRLLKRQGCYVIAQDEATCVVYGMPKAAVDAGVTDAILPLEAIAARLTAAARGLKG
jgi:two-component system, chemotaxis family, protein-glutamate methylesterase/glutaminase